MHRAQSEKRREQRGYVPPQWYTVQVYISQVHRAEWYVWKNTTSGNVAQCSKASCESMRRKTLNDSKKSSLNIWRLSCKSRAFQFRHRGIVKNCEYKTICFFRCETTSLVVLFHSFVKLDLAMSSFYLNFKLCHLLTISTPRVFVDMSGENYDVLCVWKQP